MPRERNPIDARVGARIRAARMAKGVSQEKLAAAVGVTFQQVQKYEKGANRVGASRMVEIAAALDVQVAWFYEGVAGAGAGSSDPMSAEVTDFLGSAYGLGIVAILATIKDPGMKQAVLAAVRAAAEIANRA